MHDRDMVVDCRRGHGMLIHMEIVHGDWRGFCDRVQVMTTEVVPARTGGEREMQSRMRVGTDLLHCHNPGLHRIVCRPDQVCEATGVVNRWYAAQERACIVSGVHSLHDLGRLVPVWMRRIEGALHFVCDLLVT